MKKAQRSNRLKVILTMAVINLFYRPNDPYHWFGYFSSALTSSLGPLILFSSVMNINIRFYDVIRSQDCSMFHRLFYSV